ncbi:RICIN domain-containing protein [Streptomyces sp. HPF1205]|uniref:RICIN domain-containing protein n=1 Tax=Streptomyces sp. HPF1205 TaxID=2873262 RepID=UPI001CED27F9|nr:RICIN domain-containing protein [Streptomyces sp. HPF1205]
MPHQQKPQDPALLDGASSRFADAFLRRTTQGRSGGGPGPRPWMWIAGAAAATGAVVLIVFAVARISSDTGAKKNTAAVVSTSPTASHGTRTTTAPKGGSPAPGRTGGTGRSAGGPDRSGGVAAVPGTGGGTSGGSGGAGGVPAPAQAPAPAPTTGSGSSSASGGSGGTQVKKPAQAPQSAVYPGVAVVGHASGRCVSATGHRNSKATDGTPLEIYDCVGGSWQKIDFRSDGTARIYGLCMDIAWASQDDGAAIQLANCNGGWAQKFTLNSSFDLVNTVIGKCVDVTDNGTANGTRLQLWTCAGTRNQKWSKG